MRQKKMSVPPGTIEMFSPEISAWIHLAGEICGLLTLSNRDIGPNWWSDIVGARPDKLVVGALFLDMSSPAGDPSHYK
jgi:hypothetical protein